MRRARALLPALCAFAGVHCTHDDALAPRERDRLSAGTWGGDNAALIVTDSVAHLHIACTFGDIAGRIALEANGTFARDGTYQPRAFPVISGPPVPARFTGALRNGVLTISAVVNDTVTKTIRAYGPVALVLGATPRLGPCPICRVPTAAAPP